MEFTPNIQYISTLLEPFVGKIETDKLCKEAISAAGLLQKSTNYEIDDFIKICEALKKKGGRAQIVGMTGVTQAKCYSMLQSH